MISDYKINEQALSTMNSAMFSLSIPIIPQLTRIHKMYWQVGG